MTATRSGRRPATIFGDVEPLSDQEHNDLLLDRIQRRRETLLAEIEVECRFDAQFLARVLKTLRPLAKLGHPAPGAWRQQYVETTVAALRGRGMRPGQIVERLVLALNLSTTQARRLYDAAGKPTGDAAGKRRRNRSTPARG
jgi:hypothetical protein